METHVRKTLAIIMLLITAWAVLPGVAQAHDVSPTVTVMSHDMAGCPECPEQDASPHEMSKKCHYGATCGIAVHAIPTVPSFSLFAPLVKGPTYPDVVSRLNSVALARDLPPPRT